MEQNSARSKKRIKIIILVLVLIAAVAGCIATVITYDDHKEYQDESEFISFADSRFTETNIAGAYYDAHVDYVYDEDMSYAVDYSGKGNDEITAFREQKVNEIISEFQNRDMNENSAVNAVIETVKSDDDNDADEALLINAHIQESDNGVNNLLIYSRTVKEGGDEPYEQNRSVATYQFSKETGEMIVPQQIFQNDYKKICADHFTDYFTSYYTEEELNDNWREYLTPTEGNFNKFTVDSAGAVFFFDAGTVLKESEGIVCAGIPALQNDKLIRDKIIKRYIDPAKPMVAITFDDGPGLESEDRILSCLESNNAVATFFYQGAFISGREAKIKRAYDIGCELGHHTWNHPVLTSLTDAQVSEQITKTNDAIYAACGHYPTVFRPGYGITNDKINASSAMPVIMWSVDTLDWKLRDGQKVFERVQKSGNLDGKIILMHSIHDSTADATELIVPWLKSQGYQLVTVSELIKYKTGADPVAGTTYR